MTMKCQACGMDFPADAAKCKECKTHMKCEEGTCKCENCGHAQPMDNMWCTSCLQKNAAS